MVDPVWQHLLDTLQARVAQAKADTKRLSPYDDNRSWNQRRGRAAGIEEALALVREAADSHDGSDRPTESSFCQRERPR